MNHIKTSPTKLVDKRNVIGTLSPEKKIYKNHIDVIEIVYFHNFSNEKNNYYSLYSGWRMELASISRYQPVNRFTDNDPKYHYSLQEMGLYTQQRYR